MRGLKKNWDLIKPKRKEVDLTWKIEKDHAELLEFEKLREKTMIEINKTIALPDYLL